MIHEKLAPARAHNAPGEKNYHHAGDAGSLIERPARRNSARAHLLGEILDDALAAGADLSTCAAAGSAFSAFLTAREIVLLSWALTRSLSPRAAAGIVEAAFPAAGPPLPPFTDPRDDAAEWASRASRAELRAYATAAFQALDRADRRAFAKRVGRLGK
ncbi:hypothetical protein [Rhodosalinus sediminis]|uniref:hypothetical protein n=1 Tax=Rhodosalinus sediminis TaxID=1940533 RepID=UPI00235556A9|nr:hypothetical protein [Rhodosalinus sediminis]